MADIEEDEEELETKLAKRRPLVDGKTVVIGGGVVALILFLFFRGGGGGGGGDKRPLEFRLRKDGLYLGYYEKFQTYSEAIDRIKRGGKTVIVLIVAGDVPQGEVDRAITAFTAGGITINLKQPQTVASLYQRGMGGIA